MSLFQRKKPDYPVDVQEKSKANLARFFEDVGTDMAGWSEEDLREYDVLWGRVDRAFTAGDVKAFCRAGEQLEKLLREHGLGASCELLGDEEEK